MSFLFLLIYMFFVIFFTILNFFSNNLFVWWSVFLLMTMVFLLLLKSDKSYSSLLNYFIIQESLGLMFLIFSFGFLQFLILLMKVGVTPFHFWIFSITNNLSGWNLIWFLTFQKFPFLPVFLQVFNFDYLIILLLGILIVYFQLFLMKNLKNMLILSSLESFNWILLTCYFSFVNIMYLFFFYMIVMIFLMVSVGKKDDLVLDWELVLVFMNIPFSISFFVKIFSLSEVFLMGGIYLVFILFFMFLSMLSFSYWLMFISVECFKGFLGNLDFSYFIIFPLLILCLLY